MEIELATPSLVFSKIFPTKPSQVITSTSPLKISPPSTFPIKYGYDFKSLNASLVTSFPLLSSSPFDKSPTFGLSMLKTSFA